MATQQKEQLTRFQRLFRGRENVHGQWQTSSRQTYREPAPESAWTKHLKGQGPILGIVPVLLDNTAYFGAIDVDDDTVDHAALAGIIEHAGLPLVTCRSKSGGAHLYVFTSEPATAKQVQQKLKQWADALGLNKNPDGRIIEVFPKNSKLAINEAGNWINLPYYAGSKTDRYAVTPAGKRLSLAEFLDYAEERRVSTAQLQALTGKGEDTFERGPPCLNTLDRLGYPEGARNMGLYNVGIYLKMAHPDSWPDLLAEYNEAKMDPPLSDTEVKAIAKSLEKRDYIYKCEELPISPHCEKVLCRKQKWGINAFKKAALNGHMPELGNLRKIMTDPPRWLLTVAGDEIELVTEELMMLPRFRRVVLEKCSKIFPLMKQQDWDDILGDLLTSQETIEVPEDAGTFGQFRNLLYEFLLRRKSAESKEDLLAGLPVQEGPKVFFRSSDLIDFLERKKFRDYAPGKIFTVLRSLGAGHTKFNIKGAGVQAWYIEAPSEEQSEDFTPRESANADF